MVSGPEESDGWREWSKHVLIELQRLDRDIKDIKELVIEHRTEMAVIKSRTEDIGERPRGARIKDSSLGGGVGALIVGVIMALYEYFKAKSGG